MNDLAFFPAVELAKKIRNKQISCRDILEHYKARLDRYGPILNAVVVTDFDRAYERADQADAALARGELWGPMHGIPMTVKESYDVAGFATTWGAPDFKDYFPVDDAIAVSRLIAAGANIFGKTNVPFLLGDLQTHNEIYGTTNNPWNLKHTPGGSSGGAAAALAAGLTGLEAGSDIVSSIRTPAHYCGVYGHKPTFGIVTTRGQLIPGRVAFSDLAVVGPMARSPADLALALEVMSGADAVDSRAWTLQLPKPVKLRLSDYRVAVMLETYHARVDHEIRDQIGKLADALGRTGASVSFGARPDFDTEEADHLFQRLLGAAFSGRQSDEQCEHNLKAFGSLAPDNISYSAQAIRAAALSHRDWLIANETRHRMRLKWSEFFQSYDVLLCPAAASTAPIHNHKGDPFERPIQVNGAPVPLSSQFFWAGYSSLAYLPSTVAPIGVTDQGLPVGVQIIGPQYGDLSCIHFAGLLEESYRGFVIPPGY